MIIKVGTGPDFLMSRGKVVIFHRCDIELIEKRRNIYSAIITDRSLYSLARQVSSVLRSQNIDFLNNSWTMHQSRKPGLHEQVWSEGKRECILRVATDQSITGVIESEIITSFLRYFKDGQSR